jgi:Metallo-peptidase family M12B Reprolysin-like/Secretion system C-terminal sorting domain
MKNISSFVPKRVVSFLCLLFMWASLNAQDKKDLSRDVVLNLDNIVATLAKAPMEFSADAQSQPFTFSLPTPDGNERVFKVVESPIMDKNFADAYPNFKTYSLVATDNPSVTGRITVTPYGLNAFIFLELGIMGIRPRDLMHPSVHQVYFGDGGENPQLAGKCSEEGLSSPNNKTPPASALAAPFTNGGSRRTYRFAAVTTGEFAFFNGGTVASASAVVTASVNAIQAIYDRELAVRFTLLTPVIYLDSVSDPFLPDITFGIGRPTQAAEVVNTNFALASYDIGHAFNTLPNGSITWNGGGVAGLGVVCSSNHSFSATGFNKAAGWSSDYNNTSLSWYSLFAHEVGHMFGMPHTFNGSGNGCSVGNISSSTAYEIGSGTSIMSYKNICDAAQNIPSSGAADQYFHTNSLDRAVSFLGTLGCQSTASTGNSPPVVNANPCGGVYSIPTGTPFTLTGSGTDANGDAIYYSWEQYDVSAASTQGFIGATAAASTTAPLFRSYPSTTSPSRTFPAMNLVVAGTYGSSFEPLPTVARTLNFRLTGRDYNANGGGIHSTDLAVSVVGVATGAFSVTAPNTTGLSFNAGGLVTVTWTANTTAFCSFVNIKLSTDGGLTYPYTLASNISNALGTYAATIPAGVVATNTARVKVECNNACVSFFDISNVDFAIASTCSAPATMISPVTPLTAVTGNTSLNLGLSNNFGTSVTSFAGTIATTDNPGTLIFLNNTPAVCVSGGNSVFYDTYNFSVNITGSYEIAHSAGGTVLNLYAPPFSALNCTNHLSSSGTQPSGSGGVSLNGSLTATLTAGQLYTLVVSNFGNGTPAVLPYSYTITFPTKPAASTIYNGVIAPTGYAYTFVAVNSATGNIVAQSASSSFTALTAGSYQVYGVTYYSGVPTPTPATPSSWVGLSLSTILLNSTCELFSDNFKPVTVTTVLGADLISLQAVPVNQTTRLTWQTANEINNKGFQVERLKPTGVDWDILGFVAAQTKRNNYEYVDNAPLSKNYYRLRQMDDNGKETLSKIVEVSFVNDKKLRVYPNPVTHLLTIETTEQSPIQILNLLGQIVLQAPSVRQIDVSALPQGTYVLKTKEQQAKFVKQ